MIMTYYNDNNIAHYGSNFSSITTTTTTSTTTTTITTNYGAQ